MSKKFLLWLFSVTVFVTVSIVVVLSNSETLTITLFPGKNITANQGVLILGIFLTGVAITCLVASFFGLKTYLHERSLRLLDKKRQNVYNALILARGFTAAGAFDEAQKIWQQLIKRTPNNIICYIELAKNFESSGDIANAIKTIEQARAKSPDNIEVLMYASKLHSINGNKTVALDNLVLASIHTPTPSILRLARNTAEEVGRIDDALVYHEELKKFVKLSQGDKDTEARLKYKQLIAKIRNINSFEGKKTAFSEYLKNYQYAAAETAFANLLKENNAISEAAQVLSTLAKRSMLARDWNNLCNLWLKNNDVPRAITTARLALNYTHNDEQLLAQLTLIKILLNSGNFEESKKILSSLKEIANRKTSTAIKVKINTTIAKAAYQLGLQTELKEALDSLVESEQQDIATIQE